MIWSEYDFPSPDYNSLFFSDFMKTHNIDGSRVKSYTTVRKTQKNPKKTKILPNGNNTK